MLQKIETNDERLAKIAEMRSYAEHVIDLEEEATGMEAGAPEPPPTVAPTAAQPAAGPAPVGAPQGAPPAMVPPPSGASPQQ